MRMIKSIKILGACVALVVAMGLTSAVAAKTTLRFGTVLVPSDPMGQGLDKFAKEVREATGGEVDVQIFHNSQLGDTRDMLDQATAGAGVLGALQLIALLRYFDVPDWGAVQTWVYVSVLTSFVILGLWGSRIARNSRSDGSSPLPSAHS